MGKWIRPPIFPSISTTSPLQSHDERQNLLLGSKHSTRSQENKNLVLSQMPSLTLNKSFRAPMFLQTSDQLATDFLGSKHQSNKRPDFRRGFTLYAPIFPSSKQRHHHVRTHHSPERTLNSLEVSLFLMEDAIEVQSLIIILSIFLNPVYYSRADTKMGSFLLKCSFTPVYACYKCIVASG